MTEQMTVPLSTLERDPANVRKANREASPMLIASVKEKGILQPLLIRPNGKCNYVTEGGRRLDALHKLKMPGDYPVPVVISERSDEEAREVSLTTNMVRAQMHPIDEFEAIAALYNGGQGLSLADIGKRFNMTEKEVRQRLALGCLHPEIREAYRQDKIDDETAEAYTMETDQTRQLKIFNGRDGKHRWGVRRAILGDDDGGGKYLKFVGREAYEAAGGKVVEDLFSDKSELHPADIKLAKKLADDKLEKKIESLKAKGWKWVMTAQEAGHGAYMWAEDKRAAKDKSGVIVELTNSGTLSVKEHVLKPSDERAKKTKKEGSKKEDSKLSQALVSRMSEAITEAASHAIAKDPHLALAAAVAALRSSCSCITLRSHNSDMNDEDFVGVFKQSLKKTDKQLMADFAHLVAQAVEMGAQTENKLPFHKDANGDAEIILNSLDPDEIIGQLQEEFDLEDYFNSVPKDRLGDAITEAINQNEYRKIAGKPKAEIAKFCIANISAKNWLPPELRVKGYKVMKAR